MTHEELKEYLIEEADYTEVTVNHMDAYDMFDAWLKYNGIRYTNDIMEVVEAAFGIKLEW